MFRKITTAVLAALAIYLLPAAGNTDALLHLQLWILAGAGLVISVFQPTYKPVDHQAPEHDRGTAAQIVWSIYLTQLVGVVEAVYFRYPESFRWDTVAKVALVVMMAGLGLRLWAVSTLGRFFTWFITVHEDHQVVRTGPFRFVRHPSYCGALILFVANLVFLHAWMGAVLSLILQLLAYLRRIHFEEAMMVERIGEPYLTYRRSVKALVPFVW